MKDISIFHPYFKPRAITNTNCRFQYGWFSAKRLCFSEEAFYSRERSYETILLTAKSNALILPTRFILLRPLLFENILTTCYTRHVFMFLYLLQKLFLCYCIISQGEQWISSFEKFRNFELLKIFSYLYFSIFNNICI